ncbi:E3 ubiquitin-protein ligase RNF165-like [Ischnura elegans]|uniref:E3 ubiquitin-protein ligase RNF165-like n=1 Tax=Ischnura elegans TaxID=197161 RepID=UPI001ED8A740|nr:E3 ubiquitin-protein ligase RNF165-like [Ischnura elegans]
MHPIYSTAAVVIGAIVLGVVMYFSNRETPQQHSYSERRPKTRRNTDNRDWGSNNNSGGDDNCAICLELLSGPVKTLRCRHEFHSQCISQWFQSNNGVQTCPLCRHP